MLLVFLFSLRLSPSLFVLFGLDNEYKATKDGHIRSLLIVLFDSGIDDSTNILYIIFFIFFSDLNLLQIAPITTGSIINFRKTLVSYDPLC